jgi:hypothetical protein
MLSEERKGRCSATSLGAVLAQVLSLIRKLDVAPVSGTVEGRDLLVVAQYLAGHHVHHFIGYPISYTRYFHK